MNKKETPQKVPTVSSAIAGQILSGLIQLGLPAPELIQRSSLNPELLKDPDARLPIDISKKLILLGIELSNNAAIALKVGEVTRLEQTGIMGHLLKNSRRLKDAMALAGRFHRLINNSDNWRCTTENDHIHVIYEIADTNYFDIHRLELVFSSALTVFRQLTGTDICPEKVCFDFPTPEYASEYERIFRCPLEFDSSQNAFLFHKDVLDTEIPTTHDPYLDKVLTNHANQLLLKLETFQSFQDKVRKLLIENISSGQMSIEWIAEQAGMSRWTLNRRLNEEGVSFKAA
ncbi:MAG: AraC family transcriptional regulator [SAR324 cluster bacterium]|nr:AraC family transcriptional regulator [SAR324 cluster bacterium]